MELIGPNRKRPDFLSALCILSFIGLGWRILRSSLDMVAGFFAAAFAPLLDDALKDLNLESEPGTGIARQFIFAIQNLLHHITAYGLLRIIFSVGAVFGVILMWNLNRKGFYLYAACRVLILLVPVIVMGFNIISVFMITSGIVFTTLFIILYGANYKYLN
jgi:hypothetical protein